MPFWELQSSTIFIKALNVPPSHRRFYKHYFIVISFLIVFDNAFSFAFYRIPYYKIFKLLLIGWLSIPMGTGPHFIYNVYIKNIHKLFEGDIDSVINSFWSYVEQAKSKYAEIVRASKKGGKIEIGFNDTEALTASKPSPVEESDVADASAVSDFAFYFFWRGWAHVMNALVHYMALLGSGAQGAGVNGDDDTLSWYRNVGSIAVNMYWWGIIACGGIQVALALRLALHPKTARQLVPAWVAFMYLVMGLFIGLWHKFPPEWVGIFGFVGPWFLLMAVLSRLCSYAARQSESQTEDEHATLCQQLECNGLGAAALWLLMCLPVEISWQHINNRTLSIYRLLIADFFFFRMGQSFQSTAIQSRPANVGDVELASIGTRGTGVGGLSMNTPLTMTALPSSSDAASVVELSKQTAGNIQKNAEVTDVCSGQGASELAPLPSNVSVAAIAAEHGATAQSRHDDAESFDDAQSFRSLENESARHSICSIDADRNRSHSDPDSIGMESPGAVTPGEPAELPGFGAHLDEEMHPDRVLARAKIALQRFEPSQH